MEIRPMNPNVTGQQIWAYDCEWVPDLEAGRRLYFDGATDVPARDILQVMWENARGYDVEKNPQPFLKTIQCRLVSIATVVRREPLQRGAQAKLSLWSVPALGKSLVGEPLVSKDVAERSILESFLSHYEKRQPVLVGYNSRNADMHILLQRAFVNGLRLPSFFEEAGAKPWNQSSVDLMDFLGGSGANYSATLNEVARLCGIPGKMDTHGDDVAGMWYSGDEAQVRGIVEYNVFDALTTYLLWLRMEYFKGRFSAEQYRVEQLLVRDLIESEAEKPGFGFLPKFSAAWRQLSPEIFE